MKNTSNSNKNLSKTLMLTALILGAAAVAAASIFFLNADSKTSIALDVNPSVELQLDSSDRVSRVFARNEDGKEILRNLELKNAPYDTAITDLVEIMLDEGYLSKENSTVLLSVKSDDDDRSRALEQAAFETLSANSAAELNVLTQRVGDDGKADKLAEKYKVSPAKAYFCQNLAARQDHWNLEQLIAMPLDDLVTLTAENVRSSDADFCRVSNAAQTAVYLGFDRAEEIALSLLREKYPRAAVTESEFDLDSDTGKWVYEIELRVSDAAGAAEYQVELDAVTGKLLDWETNDDSDEMQTADALVGMAEARKNALTHVGGGTVLDQELEHESDSWYYDIDILTGTAKHELKVDARSGEIFDSRTETVKNSAETGWITAEEAGKIARRKTGNGSVMECELDEEDGLFFYEVEILTSSAKYEFEIDAASGKILEKDVDSFRNTSDKRISAAEAEKIALKKIGGGTVTESELDEDDGLLCYEITVETASAEYELKIDAVSGKILEREKDD